MSKLILVALAVGALWSAAGDNAQENPAATHISAADILATTGSAPEGRVSDQQIRHIDAGGHNVGLGVVQRPPSSSLGAIQHHKQTEVYYVVSGRGTLVTGGELTDGRALDPEGQTVRTLTGPSSVGGIEGGESRDVGPGDMVIIPAGSPHGFSEITETITYIVVRVDPEQLVELK
ncbi:cupin domain-containing protein [Candidatus Palauibacter sp.]|uniref:cupin domain-containing protein n=1 Tax=Candidatus Palauibacter sp. TaxID=3101350 RepID=UPI003C6EA6B0